MLQCFSKSPFNVGYCDYSESHYRSQLVHTGEERGEGEGKGREGRGSERQKEGKGEGKGSTEATTPRYIYVYTFTEDVVPHISGNLPVEFTQNMFRDARWSTEYIFFN